VLAQKRGSATVNTVILSEDPWPPYIIGEEGSEATSGIAVDILRQVFSRLEVPLLMKLYPWSRSLRLVKQGTEDGHMLLLRSAQWDKYMIYSTEFIEDRLLLWTLKGAQHEINWQKFKDLQPYAIGITGNYSYGAAFNRAVAMHKLNIYSAVSDELNFKLLKAGRFDAFVCLESVALALFKRHRYLENTFIAAPKPIAQLSLTMAFNRQSPAVSLLPQINEQLKIMEQQGEIASIIARYQGVN